MNNRQSNSETFLDASLFYGLPGIVIIIVSLMAAVKIGADFGADGMVRTGIFLGSNMLLWLTYYTLFISLPDMVMQCLGKRECSITTESVIESIVIEESVLPQMPLLCEVIESSIPNEGNSENDEHVIIEEQPHLAEVEKPMLEIDAEELLPEEESTVIEALHEALPNEFPFVEEEAIITEEIPTIADTTVAEPVIKPLDTLNYQAICLEYEQRKMAEKAELIDDIVEYAGRTMAPFVSEKNMIRLCEEIRCWCSNPRYEPKEIDLRERLSTNDLCHFIWNIGERLGRSNGYNGECRARFLKRMFAYTLSEVELPSLKNMTKRTSVDKIHLDVPKPGNMKFHYPIEDKASLELRKSA